MKRTSLLLSLIVLTSGFSSAFAEEKPVLQTAEPFVEPQVLLAAETMVKREVMDVLQNPAGNALASSFDRVSVPVFSRSFGLYFTNQAPNGVTKTPVQLPFDVKRQGNSHVLEPAFLSGYYDGNTKTVQLFSAAAKAYVPAAEHPFIKARLPKK